MTSPGGFDLGTARGRVVIDASGVGTAMQGAQQAVGNFAQRAGQRMQDFGASMQSLGRDITILTAPLMAFGVTGIRTASDFEDAMAEISARTGLTGGSLERISDLAIQMGADTFFSAQDAANAFLQLLSSGQSVEEAIATLPAVLDGAAVSNMNLGTTADLVTDIMAAFGLQAEDSAMVIDAITRATSSSSATFPEMAAGFANVGGIANAFGLTVEETAAILAVFAENGIKGAEAGTQLRSMLNNMTRDTERTQGAWARLGVSMFDTHGNVRDLDEVMGDLKAAMDDLSPEERIRTIQDLAGSYGQLGLTALIGNMSIGAMTGTMREQADVSEIAARRLDTLSGDAESLQGSIETLQITALDPLIQNTLRPLIQDVTKIINQVTEWTKENPELTATLVKIGAVVALLGPAIFVLGTIISSLGTILGAVGAAAGLAGSAFTTMLGPVGLLAAAIAGLIASLKLLHEQWTRFREYDAALNQAIDSGVTSEREFTGAVVRRQREALAEGDADTAVLAGMGWWAHGLGNLVNDPGWAAQPTGPEGVGYTPGQMPTPGFARGGYTGDGAADQIAGAVHNREWVVPEGGALVLREGNEGARGDTYNINVDVPPDLLRDMPQAEINGQAFGEQIEAELRRRG